MKISTILIILSACFALGASLVAPGGRGGGAPATTTTAAPIPQYECGVEYAPYNLDNEPTTLGLSAGAYESGKQAYVGLGTWLNLGLNAGRIQTSPPSILLTVNGGKAAFFNNAGSIWYLKPKANQVFTWVPSQNGDQVPFAVDFGTNSSAAVYYFGRVTTNTTVYVGIVALYLGKLYYGIDQTFVAGEATTYEVLTCKSTIVEAPVQPPQLPSENFDTGCIHKWVAYNNDDEPATKGVSAGEYDCGNVAYVGKGNPEGIGAIRPGRIQTTSASGLYVAHKRSEFFIQNGSYYLADNPSYTYKWVTYDGANTNLNNAVYVRSPIGPLALAVTRLQFNGKYSVGFFLGLEADFADPDTKVSDLYNYYEILTCDPVPKYKCSQKWNKYNLDNAPSSDGFNAGTSNGIDVFIGRGTRKCVNGCGFNIGRIQTSPASAAGAYYAYQLSPTEVFDNVTAEYLVKNANDTYIWKPSSGGVKVVNAIESSNDKAPFYIGKTVIDHNVYVGKVLPGKGLFYIGADGKRKVTNSYAVLTCFSPDPTNGV